MVTKKPIILVDMDGVLCDYTEGLLRRVFHRFPHLKPYEDAAREAWHTHKAFPKEYRSEIENMRLSPGFFRNLPPIPGAIEGIKALAEHADVWICTTPTKIHTNCVPEKYAWVKEHLGQAWVEHIIMTRDKTLVHGSMLIDDKPRIKGARQPAWQHLLFDRPYNRHVRDKPRIDWGNWEEIVLPAFA